MHASASTSMGSWCNGASKRDTVLCRLGCGESVCALVLRCMPGGLCLGLVRGCSSGMCGGGIWNESVHC